MDFQLPISTCQISKTYRIVSTQYPPISIYERIANQDDFDILVALENATNNRLRQELGALHHLVASEDRVFGEGSGFIMAPFVYPRASRFSDGSYGVYYASKAMETSIFETKYHDEIFYNQTPTQPQPLHKRVLTAKLDAPLHEMKRDAEFAAALDPSSYDESRLFGRSLKESESWGLCYPSVRHMKGICYALFKPRALSNCKTEKYLVYEWDGEKVKSFSENTTFF